MNVSWRSVNRLMVGLASAAILIAVHPGDAAAQAKTNINLAVASNFYSRLETANPTYKVTVTNNGATATLASDIMLIFV
jgi:hypothetical protein